LTCYFTATEGERQDVLYQLNTHCHSGTQHAYRLPGQTPDSGETLANTSLADNPYARQFRPRVRDANNLPTPQQQQPLPPDEQPPPTTSAEDSTAAPDPPDQATTEIPIQPATASLKTQQRRHLFLPQAKSRLQQPQR
jgi:hypothetical protein